MANSLFNVFGGGMSPQMMGGPFGNIMAIANKFNEFQSMIQGDPHQQVQELLNSGRMTQQQFNTFSQMAPLFRQLINR